MTTRVLCLATSIAWAAWGCSNANHGTSRDSELAPGSVQCVSIDAQTGPLSSQNLPHGTCSAAQAPCSLSTSDVCPSGVGHGPVIVWNCACETGAWSCTEVNESKAVCILGDGGNGDAAVADDASSGSGSLAQCATSDATIASAADLPNGACASKAPACTLTTSDPCPSGVGHGPIIVWRCDCVASGWTCVTTSE